MKQKIIIWIFVGLFLFNNVFAIGLSPAKRNIVFEPGIQQFEYILVNNGYPCNVLKVLASIKS